MKRTNAERIPQAAAVIRSKVNVTTITQFYLILIWSWSKWNAKKETIGLQYLISKSISQARAPIKPIKNEMKVNVRLRLQLQLQHRKWTCASKVLQHPTKILPLKFAYEWTMMVRNRSRESYNELIVVLSRIVTPHSADVERCISNNSALKTKLRSKISVETENRYMIKQIQIHDNMPD